MKFSLCYWAHGLARFWVQKAHSYCHPILSGSGNIQCSRHCFVLSSLIGFRLASQRVHQNCYSAISIGLKDQMLTTSLSLHHQQKKTPQPAYLQK